MNPEHVEKLYWSLHEFAAHPFAWMAFLVRPKWWHFWAGKQHRIIRAIFASHGFILTDRVAERFNLADGQRFDEDCGGAIIRKLAYALDGQVLRIPQTQSAP